MTKEATLPMQEYQEYRALFRAGALAALFTAVFIPLQITAFAVWPPPLQANAADWFALFKNSWLVGLMSLDLLFIVDYALLVPIVLALYVALRHTSKPLATTGAAVFFVAIAAYFASNTAFEMLSLS